ncbi:hypothetical protein [Agrobacterium tumefaciens]|uniref:hypothetical protein n=1 Tax=Agrobacterium tumefaciens TaxID=358 RepID=UPI00396A6A53
MAGAGKAAGLSDDAYRAAGVTALDGAEALFAAADAIVNLRPPKTSDVDRLSAVKTPVSFFYPAQNKDCLNRPSRRVPM